MTSKSPHTRKLDPQSYPPSAFNTASSTSFSQHPMDLTKELSAGRHISRTPSPTPSEAEELRAGALNWKALMNWRFWIRRKWLWYYVAFTLITVITVLITIFHKQIVHWLTPAAHWLHDLKAGWLVPIVILFIISFPPLFGHEIVAVLCGVVWGLWAGFGIVAAGTFLGEVGNFYAFKYCCRARGEKLEKTKIFYGALARVVRDGGFKIALIARLSAIPGHFTTAVFASCGMGIFTFSLAAILSMPKQFITVYLGVILEQSETGVQDTKSKYISDGVLALTIIITIGAMWYMLRQIAKVKPQVIYERRKARQVKLDRAINAPYGITFPKGTSTESTLTGYDPRSSESEIPLTAQQWDKDGLPMRHNLAGPKDAVVSQYGDYTQTPNGLVYQPQPQRVPSNRAFKVEGRGRDIEEGAGGVTVGPKGIINGGNRGYGAGVIYPNNPSRNDSGDLAGWDMADEDHLPPSLNVDANRDPFNPYAGVRLVPSQQTQTQPQQVATNGGYPNRLASPPSNSYTDQRVQFSRTIAENEPPTPTQENVQYGNPFNPKTPMSAATVTSLPTPPYPKSPRSPPSGGQGKGQNGDRNQRLPLPAGLQVPDSIVGQGRYLGGGGHRQEATGASYVTAYSDDGSEEYVTPLHSREPSRGRSDEESGESADSPYGGLR